MWKFLLGGLVVYMFYNQTQVRRGYYTILRELRVAQRVVVTGSPELYRPLQGEAPALRTAIEVQEPSLDDMEALGFNVRREEN